MSSESFEKVLNERREIQEMKSEICLISENKECNTTKVEHYEFKKGQIIEKKFKVTKICYFQLRFSHMYQTEHLAGFLQCNP